MPDDEIEEMDGEGEERVGKPKKKMTLAQLDVAMYKKFPKIMPDPREAGVVKRLILSDPGLNRIFGGGYPLGRICEFFGPESGGKTVLSNYIAADFQRRKEGPPLVLFVDMEHTFDAKYAENVGVEIDNPLKFKLVRPLYGEQAFDICQQYVETGEVGLIIWDSVAATSTNAQTQDEYGKASFGGTAKLFSEGLRKFNPYLSHYGTSLHLINQVRDDIGARAKPGMPKPEKTTGGRAIKFYASWRGRVSQGKPILYHGEQIGNQVYVKNQKNKIGIPKRSTMMELYYSQGFNGDRAYMDFIVDLGMVDVKGSYYSKPEWGLKNAQGTDQLFDWMINHQDVFEKVKAEVNASFTKFSNFDIVDAVADPLVEAEADMVESVGTEE